MSEPTPSDPTTPGDVAPSLHGVEPARGILNVPRSSTHTGKFGRLFRGLTPLKLDDDQLQLVVSRMVDAGEESSGGGWGGPPTPSDTGLDAGWTYFAQFVDHDTTFDPTSMLDRSNDPDALENFRTPRFDLDCLYGLGPSANPWLFDRDQPFKLLVGKNGSEFLQDDLSRNHQGRALIGDPRNDVHVIIAQFHLAFVKFHNNVVDRVAADPSLVTGVPATPTGGWGAAPAGGDAPTFGQIVTLVRWHYQWLVLRQFLPAIVGTDTMDKVLPERKGELDAKLKLYNARRKPWMPVEFSAAAYRFGHTLVRDGYLLNGNVPALPVFSPAGDTDPHADLRGFRPIPQNWQVEWHRFFDGLPGSSKEVTQRARLFDTKIATPLHTLPASVDHLQRSLAFLNLKRGVALDLPSGEDVATAVAGKLGIDPSTVEVATDLPLPASPLWYWILREAQEKASGQTLGPIGGRIVAEVLVGLAENDPSSFLRVQPSWKPTLPGTGDFAMADLFDIAGLG